MLMEIKAGTMILKEGEVNMDMYKIVRGSAELYTGYGTDREAILGILSTGDFFGELGLLAQKPAIYTVIAYNDIVLLRIREDDIENYMKNNPRDAINIMKKMASSMYSLKYSMDMFVDDVVTGKAEVTKKNYQGYFSDQFAKYNVRGEPAGTKYDIKLK